MTERWKPEDNQEYYFVSNMLEVIENNYVEDCEVDRLRYKNGNCFKTQSEAQAAAEKVKALLLSLHKPVTECNQLPKLTAEVFNRPDCPEWAKYAAVDVAGLAYWYQYFPVTDERIGVWKVWENKRQLIDGFFDSSDWQNSLIERPAVLPDWVEVGGYVYDARNGYGKIVSGSVKSCYIEFDGGAGDFVPEAFAKLKQARLRPYNAEELRGLVGKVIERHSSAYLVISYAHDDLATTVYIEGKYLFADNLLRDFTIAGKPAGVLEHFENGEWVE